MDERPLWKELKMMCNQEISLYAICARSQANLLACENVRLSILNCGIMNGLNISDQSVKEFIGTIK